MVNVQLSQDQALILVDFLVENEDRWASVLRCDDAVEKVLWYLASSLESQVDAILAEDYKELLGEAKARVIESRE